MLKLLKENSFRALLINLFIIVALGVGAVLLFFYYYLPAVTNHGETITVPDLTGLQIDEVQGKLEELGLRYEIYDSSASNYSADYLPKAVLSHNPSKEKKVKLNRKIYLTINPTTPPMIELPDLVDGSVKNAQILLRGLGLKLGELEFIDAPFANTIEKLRYEDKELEKEELREGIEVPKGSVIDLIVRNGLGKSEMAIPNLVGMQLDEALESMIGVGLVEGEIHYEKSSQPLGAILKQKPEAEEGKLIRVGQTIDLWVSGHMPDESMLENISRDTTSSDN